MALAGHRGGYVDNPIQEVPGALKAWGMKLSTQPYAAYPISYENE